MSGVKKEKRTSDEAPPMSGDRPDVSYLRPTGILSRLKALALQLLKRAVTTAAPYVGLGVVPLAAVYRNREQREHKDKEVPPIVLAAPESFEALVEQVLAANRTLLRHNRLYVIWQALSATAALGLPAAEVGTFKGGSAWFIAAGLRQLAGRQLPVHVFDTFKGHPEATIDKSVETGHHVGLFEDTSYEGVKAYLSEFDQVSVYEGDFTLIGPSLPERTYGFVHLDVDTYLATLFCLRYFLPRLATGGVIIVDDYGAKKCPGTVQAIKEIRSEVSGVQLWQMRSEQCVVVKTASGPAPTREGTASG